MNFEPILVLLTILSGVLSLVDIVFLAPKRRVLLDQVLKDQLVERSISKRFADGVWCFFTGAKESYMKQKAAKPYEKIAVPKHVFDYARSFFPIFLLVLVFRTFLFEPFVVPTGSLEPTVLPGDFLLVNKYAYGLHPPLMRQTMMETGSPKHGDIVVFRWPPNPSINYIKRVIGLPGDHISYINKVLYVNGKEAVQVLLDKESDGTLKKSENFLGVKHNILVNPDKARRDFKDLVVPRGHYFMMGDNRDNSLDSRYWGFVPENNLLGEGLFIWLSKIPGYFAFRWHRVGISL